MHNFNSTQCSTGRFKAFKAEPVLYPPFYKSMVLLYNMEVDYHFPTSTVIKMAKMPFIPDPRCTNADERQFTLHQQIREEVSRTSRKPYPQEHEINLPRIKMSNEERSLI